MMGSEGSGGDGTDRVGWVFAESVNRASAGSGPERGRGGLQTAAQSKYAYFVHHRSHLFRGLLEVRSSRPRHLKPTHHANLCTVHRPCSRRR